jgi:hypothetical protein
MGTLHDNLHAFLHAEVTDWRIPAGEYTASRSSMWRNHPRLHHHPTRKRHIPCQRNVTDVNDTIRKGQILSYAPERLRYAFISKLVYFSLTGLIYISLQSVFPVAEKVRLNPGSALDIIQYIEIKT